MRKRILFILTIMAIILLIIKFIDSKNNKNQLSSVFKQEALAILIELNEQVAEERSLQSTYDAYNKLLQAYRPYNEAQEEVFLHFRTLFVEGIKFEENPDHNPQKYIDAKEKLSLLLE